MKNICVILLSWLLLSTSAVRLHAQPALFPIATNGPGYFGGSAASDGTNFLVGLQVGDINSIVGAQLISSNGAMSGPFINFGRTGGLPWVACSGTNYLVVWQDDANYPTDCIYGQIVSPVGTLVGSAFSISASSGRVDLMGPEVVAYAGGSFLVVWDDYRNGPSSVYGQIVSSSGSAVGGNFAIFPNVGSQDARNAVVTSSGTNFLVNCLYDSTGVGEHNLNRGRFIAVNGAMGGAFDISQTASLAQNPQYVIFNGANYLAAWPFASQTNSMGDPIWSLRGRFVNADSTFSGNEFEIFDTNTVTALPILAFDGSHYLLTWTEQIFTTNSMVRMQFLDTNGIPFGISFTPFMNQNGKPPMLGGAGFVNGRYFALTTVGVGFDMPGGEVYGAFIPDSAAPPQATGAMSYAEKQFTFSFSCTPGIPYVIQTSTNPATPVWSSLATNSVTNGIITFTDSGATNSGRLYRLRSP